jgi:hypothetical protein
MSERSRGENPVNNFQTALISFYGKNPTCYPYLESNQQALPGDLSAGPVLKKQSIYFKLL